MLIIYIMILAPAKSILFQLNHYFCDVKIIGFFMGLLVLALSCMPCADDDACKNPAGSTSEVAHSHARQGDEHKDACSPFCHCTCCAGFSISHFITTDIQPEVSSKNLFNSYLPANLTDISLSIWQPPQSV